MSKLIGYIKEAVDAMYNGELYWKALCISVVILLLAPIVVPTRILYRVFKAVTSEGI